MTARERLIYASHDLAEGVFFVSVEPPDSPVRPSLELASRAEVEALAKRRRARIVWWPPLVQKPAA